jgi:hypothetical protein
MTILLLLKILLFKMGLFLKLPHSYNGSRTHFLHCTYDSSMEHLVMSRLRLVMEYPANGPAFSADGKPEACRHNTTIICLRLTDLTWKVTWERG